MGDIRPIETRYKGYRFRSRLEARWAVFFEALGVEWQYERQGLGLPSGPYLPDFWLPQVKMWAEVKPEDLTATERRKCEELVAATSYPCLMLVGPPENKPHSAIEAIGADDDPVETTFSLTDYHGYVKDEGRFYGCPSEGETFPDTEEAVAAARSARFEFGESGPA